MRNARFVPCLAVALAAGLVLAGCARRAPSYVMIDPATGQQIPVQTVTQPQYAQPQYAQPQYSQPQYAQPQYAAPQAAYAQQPAAAPAPPAPQDQNRGLFTSRRTTTYAQPVQQGYVVQYGAPAAGGPYTAAPSPYGAYASAPAAYSPSYTLDSGDKLRINVFGQEGISNTYTVDAGGNINLPLVGTLPARGTTTQQLAQLITTRLKQGFVRDPHVSVEVEAYRPFFILGEVNNPGQYAYVANMTAEAAIAIAGGFSPRANKSKVELTRSGPQATHGDVPLNYPLKPGDTVVVKERWF